MSGYHQTIGVPLLAGRHLAETDRVENEPVAVVSRAMAERYWPDGSAVGSRIFRDRREWEIVGIVSDVLDADLAQEPRSTLYVPFDVAENRHALTLVMRTSRTLGDAAELLRQAVWEIDDDVPVENIATAAALVARSTQAERFRSLLLAVFAVVATLLSSVGLFGVTSRVVTGMRRELGIRLALGARRASLVHRVVADQGSTIAAGVAGGIIGSFAASGIVSRFLFGVPPWDPVSFAGAVAVLSISLLAATLLAARKAVLLDPVEAIRTE